MADEHLTALLAAFSASPIAVGLAGPDGRWRGGNDALCELLGCGQEELPSLGLEDLSHPDDRDRDLQAARRVLAGEVPCLRQVQRRLDRRGGARWIVLTASVASDDGADRCLLVQAEDAGAWTALPGSDGIIAAAERATRVRDEVLRVVSHELRNPLNTIALCTGLLLRRLPPERADERGRLELTRRAVERADQLITDLLELVQLEDGRLELQRQPEPLAPLLHEALEAHRDTAQRRTVTIEARIAEDLPPVLIDRARIGKALSCLVGRAVQLSQPGGQVVVSAARASALVEVAVSDVGPPIAAADVPVLFAPAGPAGAHGLGLALARGVLIAHGGDLWIARTGPDGTTLALSLPACAPG